MSVRPAIAAIAVAAALVSSASQSSAAGQYAIKVETTTEAVGITAYAPANSAIRMTVHVPANSIRSYALESADYYEFRLTICGKTHTTRWNRGGTGVDVRIHGCDSVSFTMQR